MPISHGLRAFQTSDSRGTYLVLSDEVTRDEMQVSGRWLKCDEPVEIQR